jgi:hypothetical protein
MSLNGNADPLLIGGASMGTCYMASFTAADTLQKVQGDTNVLDHIEGEIKNPILNATQTNGGSERGEACFGAVYGMTLAQTLREGRVKDTDFQLSDVTSQSGELIRKYITIAGHAELAVPLSESQALQDHSQNQNLEKPLRVGGSENLDGL